MTKIGRIYQGPLNSSKAIKAFFYSLTNLFKGVESETNFYDQPIVPYDAIFFTPQCPEPDCEGCDCVATPTPTPTPTQTITPTPTPPVPTPTPSSSYSFGPLSFTLNKSVP